MEGGRETFAAVGGDGDGDRPVAGGDGETRPRTSRRRGDAPRP